MTGAESTLLKGLIDLGGTVVVVCLLLIFAYKLFDKYGTRFLASQSQMAEAMGSQAASMGQLKESVALFIRHDNMDHREILLSLQVVGKELSTVVESLADVTCRQEKIETLVEEIAEHERKGPKYPAQSRESADLALSCGGIS